MSESAKFQAFETHSVLSKLEGIWIDPENTLMYALATRITFICPMKFNAFPMDVQICLFQVGKVSILRLVYHFSCSREAIKKPP